VLITVGIDVILNLRIIVMEVGVVICVTIRVRR
jgi:hypothetical protein